MLNLANEDLVKEGFKNLGMQIQQLATIEKDDLKALTENFIELKNNLENEIKERKAQAIELTNLNLMKSQAMSIIGVMKQFEEFKLNMIEALKNKQEAGAIPEIVQKEKGVIPIPEKKEEKIVQPIITEVTERYEVHCITCDKSQVILNAKKVVNEGGKRIEGVCSCGRKLFKIL